MAGTVTAWNSPSARDSNDLFTKRWDGGFASKDRLLTDGGTLMLFAALAASPPPTA